MIKMRNFDFENGSTDFAGRRHRRRGREGGKLGKDKNFKKQSKMSSELEFSDICLLVRGCLVSMLYIC